MESKLETKTYTFIYKTTNRVNNKFYVGYHTTDTIDDGYIGCGVVSQAYAEGAKRYGLKSAFIDAVCKYGYSNFTREILEFCPNVDTAKMVEAEIVNEDFVRNPMTYNIRTGGSGGGEKKHWLYNYYDDIVKRFKDGKTLKEIAEEYSVGITIVRKVIRSKGEDIERTTILPSDRKFGHLKQEIIDKYRLGASIRMLCELYKCSFKTIKRFVSGTSRLNETVIAISPDKVVMEVSSLNDIVDKYGLSKACINQCLSGKMRHHKGWLFFRESEWDGRTDVPEPAMETKYNGVRLLDPNGNVQIIEPNLNQFAKENGLGYEMLHQLINGRRKKYRGWVLFDENIPVEEQIAEANRAVVSHHKGLTFLFPDGSVRAIETNLCDFCRSYDLNPVLMSYLVNGQKQSYKGITVL